LSHTPSVQIMPVPHTALCGLLEQFQFVAAVQALQTPLQAMLQHLPPTHAFDWQSPSATQSPPAGFLAGGAQRFIVQISPVGHEEVDAIQAPPALHVDLVSVVPEAQTEAAQLVPADARPHLPAPSQPVVHASGLH
jgi:hypothetical protein